MLGDLIDRGRYLNGFGNCGIIGIIAITGIIGVIGGTGSGKSSTFARIVQNIFTTSKYLPVNANIFVFDAYGEYKNLYVLVENEENAGHYNIVNGKLVKGL